MGTFANMVRESELVRRLPFILRVPRYFGCWGSFETRPWTLRVVHRMDLWAR